MWKGGDYTNMVIGQGDVLVTPIQVAVAYGGIATGQPHEAAPAEGGAQRLGRGGASFEPEVVGTPDVKPREPGHHARRPQGRGPPTTPSSWRCSTSSGSILPPWPARPARASYADKGDYAWFACYAPFDDPKYVVACVVEQGGGGSAVGAPLGIEVLAAALNADAGELTDVGAVAGSTGKSKELATSGSSGRTD